MTDIERELYTVTRGGIELHLPVRELTQAERDEISLRLRREGEAMQAHAAALLEERRRRAQRCAGGGE